MPSSQNQYFIQQTEVSCSATRLWSFLTRLSFFSRLTPPWLRSYVDDAGGAIKPGFKARFEIKNGSLKGDWVAQVTEFRIGYLLGVDLTTPKGRKWNLWLRCLPTDTEHSTLFEVRIEMPKEDKGRAIQKNLKNISYYSLRTLKNDFEWMKKHGIPSQRKVLLAGGSGWVGSHLTRLLEFWGYDVTWLSTRKIEGTVRWDPQNGLLKKTDLEGFPIIVNLAGANIAQRWSRKAKETILKSRTESTLLLAKTIAEMDQPPVSFVQISGTGYYGYHNAKNATEVHQKGEGFLADVCEKWESAADSIKESVSCFSLLRLGVVLSPRGGALAKMLPIFQAGLGGPLAGGNQYFPWISMDDLLYQIVFAAERQGNPAIFNACVPFTPNNTKFTRKLGTAVGKPTFFPVPGFMLKLIYGEMAKEALIGGVDAVPEATQNAGFEFYDTSLHETLHSILGSWKPE